MIIDNLLCLSYIVGTQTFEKINKLQTFSNHDALRQVLAGYKANVLCDRLDQV